jgi:hypothetical protein
VAELRLVRPMPRVKRFVLGLAGVTLGAAVFAGGAMLLLSLFTNANVSVGFANHSKTTIQNLVVSCPDFSRSPNTSLAPGEGFAFSAPAHRKFNIRVSFDADGQHFEIPTRVLLFSLGDYMVSLSIDDQMKLATQARVI